MAVSSRSRELSKQWKERETSPERTKVWTEPKPTRPNRKVPVVYYLTRSGQLEHPHFIEVPLSSNDGLYLKDVINRLNLLRGKGMASMYSWSSKRSYKNGFVWHDLSDDDFIYPAHGNEYVLKGSEIIQPAFAAIEDTTETPLMDEVPRSAVARDSASASSFDLNEYKVYKNDLTAEAAGKAAHASTQTDDRRRHRRALDRAENPIAEVENPTTELGRDEISPPPSSSSPETLESLIRSDGRLVEIRADDQDRTAGSGGGGGGGGGRNKASAVLMHLISCGSISVKDHEFSLVTQYKRRLPRVTSGIGTREMDGPLETPSFPAVRMEDKEYFSGSLIETKKRGADFASLKRSSSYNADRGSKLELAAEKEIEGGRGRCIPRRPKPLQRESQISRSAHGSKRINDEPPQYKEN